MERLDVLIVLNPAAPRHSPDEVLAALTALRDRGIRYRVLRAPSEGDARKAVGRGVRDALKAGCKRIVAAGGDGTLAMVAEPLARNGSTPASLGIIPAGTANVMAHELGIPMALGDAVAIAAEGDQTLEVDAIEAGDRHVLTQVGIGPDALMIRDTSRQDQAKLGRLAYIIAFIRRAIGHRALRFELEIDGQTLHARAWQVVIANVGSLGTPPLTWGPGIDPTDGILDVCIFNRRRLRDYLTLVWRIVSGRHRRDVTTRFHRVRDRVTVRSDRPLLVQGDGEIIGRTPVTLRVARHSVRIVVPRAVEEISPPPPKAVQPKGAITPKAQAAETVGQDVHQMIAQRSRTWVLQGALRHPIASFGALDAALFLRINSVALGPTLDRALWLISKGMHYGEGWAPVVLVMLAVNMRLGLRAAAEALPVLWLTMLTVNFPMKALFRRRRPFITYVNARVVGPKPRDFSFPSGHTAAAFAGALIFGADAPVFSPLFYALAIVVGFSRIYLGVHYPSDVVIGAVAGSLLASVYRAIIHALVPGLG